MLALLLHLARGPRRCSGSVSAVATMTMVCGIALAALVVDLSKYYLDRRKAQSVADLAAIAGASNIAGAVDAVNATVAANGLTLTAPPQIDFGTYVPSLSLSPSNRFQAAAPPSANAVRVTLRTQTPLFFGGHIIGQSTLPVRTVATAANTGFVAFAVGTRLASLDGGLLNQILGSMLGTNLSLSVMDYRSLLAAKVDLFDFLQALATRASISGPTYASVLSANVSVSSVLAAMADAAGQDGAAGGPLLAGLAQAAQGSSRTIQIGALVDAGPYDRLVLGQKPPGVATVSLFDLLTGSAQIANGTRQLALSLNLTVPGVTQANLILSVGQRPVGSGYFAIGGGGTVVHTAQTRLLLTLTVPALAPLASLTIPLFVEVARATATVTSVACDYVNASNSAVTLGVTPGLLNGWIGNVSQLELGDFSREPVPAPAIIATVAGLGLSGQATANIGDTSPTPVTFSAADVSAQTVKTVRTTNFSGSLTSSLLGDLRLNLLVGGLQYPAPLGVPQSVTATLQPLASLVDGELATLLAALGVGLGEADVWTTGLRCDGAVLVN